MKMNGATEITLSNATVTSGVGISATMTSNNHNAEDETIPQWKRDFLAKKKTLLLHQQARLKQVAVPSSSDSESGEKTDNEQTDLPSKATQGDEKVKVNGDTPSPVPAVVNGFLPAEPDTEDDDVDSDVDSSMDGDSTDDETVDGKSGGYSFLTAEKYDPDDETESRESSELIIPKEPNVSENKSSTQLADVVVKSAQETSKVASDSAETDTDGSANELPYKPGFVSKLLNKWSSITDQPSNYSPQPSGTKPTSLTVSAPSSSAVVNSTRCTTPAEDRNYSPSNSRSVSQPAAPRPAAEHTPYQTSSSPSRAARPNSGILGADSKSPDEGVSDSVSEELVKRIASYRAPSEIILIESPREQLREGSVSCEDKLPDLSVDTTSEISASQQSDDSPSHRPSSEWHAQLPVHGKVLIAKSVFESSNPSLPTAPPRKKRGSKVYSPPLSPPLCSSPPPVPSPVLLDATPSLSDQQHTAKREPSVSSEVDGSMKTRSEPTGVQTNNSIATEVPKNKEMEKKGQSVQSRPVSHRTDPAPSVPLFAKFKLKQTNHKLYGNEEEKDSIPPKSPSNQNSEAVKHNNDTMTNKNAAPAKPDAQSTNQKAGPIKQNSFTAKPATEGPLSPRTRARLAKAKAPQPPTQAQSFIKPSVDSQEKATADTVDKTVKQQSVPSVNSYLSSRQDNMLIISSTDKKSAETKPDKPIIHDSKKNGDVVKQQDLPKTNTHQAKKTADAKVVKPPREEPKPIASQAPSYSTKSSITAPKADASIKPQPNSQSQKADSPKLDVKIPRPEVKLNASSGTVTQTLYSNKTTNQSSQAASKPPTVAVDKKNATSNGVPSKPVVSAVTSEPSKNKPAATINSVKDIPSPARNKTPPKPAVNQSSSNDLQAVWNKRQERSQSKSGGSSGVDVPVTNIDDVVLRSSSSRGNSRPVFDSRKAMAGKRKVPEYEKIHSGPVQQFTDTEVKVGKSCLKPQTSAVASKSNKKNLSFNEISISSVHEYLSEKVMIQDNAKEKGAIYWDDPDHLQAAPDRSIDEPEANATTGPKSSLRAALNNTPNITAGSTLATHTSSYHGDYSFGQTLNSDTSDSYVTLDDATEDTNGDTSDFIKPAGESDVKSWSSAGSSDMLF